MRVTRRINVSSCALVVTLRGVARSAEEKGEIEDAVRAVLGVDNRLRTDRG